MKLFIPQIEQELSCEEVRKIHKGLQQIVDEDTGNWVWSIRYLDNRFKGVDSPVHELKNTLLPEEHKDSPVILLFWYYRKQLCDICIQAYIVNMQPNDVDDLVSYLSEIAHEEQGVLGKKTLNQVQSMYQGDDRWDAPMKDRIISSKSFLPPYLWDCPIRSILKNVNKLSSFVA